MAKIQTNKWLNPKSKPTCRSDGDISRPVFERYRTAFTLVEVIMVVVIISIAALGIVPLMSMGTQTQAYTATEMIVADLDYARNLAMTRGKIYSVRFDTTNESYQIEDPNGNVIMHPINKRDYVVDFANHAQLSQVDIVSANFDTTSVVKFDYLGAPWNGLVPPTPLTSGSVVISSDAVTQTISVEPVTGFITSQ